MNNLFSVLPVGVKNVFSSRSAYILSGESGEMMCLIQPGRNAFQFTQPVQKN